MHTCFGTCHPAPDNPANGNSPPDNEDIVSDSMKVEMNESSLRMQHQFNTVTAAALGVDL